MLSSSAPASELERVSPEGESRGRTWDRNCVRKRFLEEAIGRSDEFSGEHAELDPTCRDDSRIRRVEMLWWRAEEGRHQ